MAFCSNCGISVTDEARFCENCGARLSGAEQQAYPGAAPQPAVTDNSKAIAIIAVVFPLLFFLPLLVPPKTAFGTFWANQALILFLASLVAGLLCVIVIGLVLYLVLFVFWIIALVNVCQDKMTPLPLIGGIKIIE
ncbi:MAG: zinc ribbon domain-containing protein [Syntrophomonadaceae bacterium]|nr:zinc ribbon domain-containing protein [Syntrophomonadaceae bacterium]